MRRPAWDNDWRIIIISIAPGRTAQYVPIIGTAPNIAANTENRIKSKISIIQYKSNHEINSFQIKKINS